MAGPIKIDNTGMQEFDIGGAKFSVDLFQAVNRITEIQEQYQDGKGGDLKHYVDMLKEISGTSFSSAVAVQFVNAVVEEAAAVKGFIESKQKLPQSTAASTASTPASTAA